MKGYVMAILFAFGLEMSLMAQVDRFFMYQNEYNYKENASEYEVILLPKEHGWDYNYYAENVPLESGCLLLLGMGLLYTRFKKKN